MEGVVGERNALILRDGYGRLELAGVEAAVSVVVEGDAELLAGLDAEAEGVEACELEAARGNSRVGGNPGFDSSHKGDTFMAVMAPQQDRS